VSASSAPSPLAPPATFEAPWQLRAYVIAAALVEQDILDPSAFGEAGAEALRSWLTTVQQTLLAQGHVSIEELDAEIARQVAAAAARDIH